MPSSAALSASHIRYVAEMQRYGLVLVPGVAEANLPNAAHITAISVSPRRCEVPDRQRSQ